MRPKYEVPLVPPNLRKEETIVQIAEALAYLSDVSSDIFRRIDGRVERNRRKIGEVTGRIEAAKSKLDRLSGSKKATRVFSCSKYPAADVNRNYRSVFDDDDGGGKLPVRKFEYKYGNEGVAEEATDKLRFYHVTTTKAKAETVKSGLGKPPTDVEMANDLLLYGSGVNPYRKYVLSSNALDGSQGSKHERSSDDARSIDAAPTSISDRAHPTRPVAAAAYFYSPDLGDVPDIDVPLDLPDLPGVADDLRYADGTGPGIAPSVATTPNVPDLPDITPVEVEPILVEAKPVPVPVEVKPVEFTSVPQPEVVVQPKTEVIKDDVVDVAPKVSVPVPMSDARKNLMDAIRKAGEAKTLRPVGSKTEETKAAPSGDLMADLHAKLSMRRKGISGSKRQDGTADVSAMDRISAMIPPPPQKTDPVEEDDEWDD